MPIRNRYQSVESNMLPQTLRSGVMGNLLKTMGVVVFLGTGLLPATDIVNLDPASYKVKVETSGGEGNVVISFHRVAAGATISGLCDHASCTLEIPDSRVTVKKDERVLIHHGRFVVQPPLERQ
jgi:hypothetical protein